MTSTETAPKAAVAGKIQWRVAYNLPPAPNVASEQRMDAFRRQLDNYEGVSNNLLKDLSTLV